MTKVVCKCLDTPFRTKFHQIIVASPERNLYIEAQPIMAALSEMDVNLYGKLMYKTTHLCKAWLGDKWVKICTWDCSHPAHPLVYEFTINNRSLPEWMYEPSSPQEQVASHTTASHDMLYLDLLFLQHGVALHELVLRWCVEPSQSAHSSVVWRHLEAQGSRYD